MAVPNLVEGKLKQIDHLSKTIINLEISLRIMFQNSLGTGTMDSTRKTRLLSTVNCIIQNHNDSIFLAKEIVCLQKNELEFIKALRLTSKNEENAHNVLNKDLLVPSSETQDTKLPTQLNSDFFELCNPRKKVFLKGLCTDSKKKHALICASGSFLLGSEVYRLLTANVEMYRLIKSTLFKQYPYSREKSWYFLKNSLKSLSVRDHHQSWLVMKERIDSYGQQCVIPPLKTDTIHEKLSMMSRFEVYNFYFDYLYHKNVLMSLISSLRIHICHPSMDFENAESVIGRESRLFKYFTIFSLGNKCQVFVLDVSISFNRVHHLILLAHTSTDAEINPAQDRILEFSEQNSVECFEFHRLVNVQQKVVPNTSVCPRVFLLLLLLFGMPFKFEFMSLLSEESVEVGIWDSDVCGGWHEQIWENIEWPTSLLA